MTHEISTELAQRILSYLADRPYKEVFALIPALQAIKPVVTPAKEPNRE